MNGAKDSPRLALLREAATLQIKLLVDGLRDALLIPLSLVAAAIGLLRGGPDCDREYRNVIKRWINLFGHQRPLGKPGPASSFDAVLGQVENTVIEQYRKGRKADGKDAESATQKDQEGH